MYVRTVQIVLVLVALVLFRPQKSEGVVALILFAILSIVEAVMLGFVQGEATTEGIAFCRWRVWKIVRWGDVEGVWEHSLTKQIIVKVSPVRLPSRYLLLSRPNPPLDVFNEEGTPAARLRKLIDS